MTISDNVQAQPFLDARNICVAAADVGYYRKTNPEKLIILRYAEIEAASDGNRLPVSPMHIRLQIMESEGKIYL